MKALKDKLVILVTHQLQFLRECEKIMVLQDGKQVMLGNFEQITRQGFNVEEILQAYNQAAESKEKQGKSDASDVKKATLKRSTTLDVFR